MSNIKNLLGLPLGDEKITQFLNSLDQNHEALKTEKRIQDHLYHEYKKLGLSFEFVGKEKPVLDAIFLYNEGCYGFSKFKGKLPFDLSFDNVNVDIVKRFGEPEKKGGTRIPVWISYEKLGLQIDFINKSFEDLKNPIAFVTIFPPTTK